MMVVGFCYRRKVVRYIYNFDSYWSYVHQLWDSVSVRYFTSKKGDLLVV